MRLLQIQSVTRVKKKNYIPSTPQITAENILNRDSTLTRVLGDSEIGIILSQTLHLKRGID